MHVIDMAFSPVGLPLYEKSSFMKSGNNLKWHPNGNIFYGSGITEKKSPFRITLIGFHLADGVLNG